MEDIAGITSVEEVTKQNRAERECLKNDICVT